MPSAFGKPVTTANRFGAVAAAQVWTLVTTLTASSSASLSYTSFASASYKSYKLIFSRILPATNDTNWNVNASVDGGANYGALWTGNTLHNDNSAAWGNAITTALTNNPIVIQSSNQGSSALSGIYGELIFNYSPTAGTASAITGMLGSRNNASSRIAPQITHAVYDNATEVNALKFLFSSGNIASGTIRIYGIT